MKPDSAKHPRWKNRPNGGSASRYYRFGLCGLSAGGKSCLLAALDLPRVPNPRGLTAVAVNLEANSAQDLVDGKKWIHDACDKLKQGSVPDPTPPAGRLTLRYKFTDKNSGEWFVELVDYSGEILSPENTRDELATSLRRYFMEVDGFLFVAEHPRDGELPAELAGYIANLTKALATMREQAKGAQDAITAPIALLVNKWDRTGHLDPSDQGYQAELDKLQRFLDETPKPPHADLLAQLEAAASGKCRAFPVSAFGESVLDPDSLLGHAEERPVRVEPQLPSFGLEEPFLWLTEQCEEEIAKRLDRESRRKKTRINIFAANRCRSAVKMEIGRVRSKSPVRPTLQKARSWIRGVILLQVAVMILLLMAVELSIDVYGHRSARTSLKTPTDPSGFTKAEKWYQSYLDAPQFRHVFHRQFILSDPAARAEWEGVLRGREEAAWQPVVISDEPEQKARLAKVFLSKFPESPHRPEAEKFVADWELFVRRREFDRILTKLEADLDAVSTRVQKEREKKNGIREPKSIQVDLSRISNDVTASDKNSVSDKQIKRLRKVDDRISSLNQELVRMIEESNVRERYKALVRAQQWPEAAELLLGLSRNDFADLREDFAGKVIHGVTSKSMNKLGNGAAWKDALDYLAPFQKEPIRSLLPAGGTRDLGKIESEIKAKGDQWLYKKCTSGFGPEPFREYKNHAPIGSMMPVVEEWLRFLEVKEKKARFRFGISAIDWSADAHKADAVGDEEIKLVIKVEELNAATHHFESSSKGRQKIDPKRYCSTVDDIVASKPRKISVKLSEVDQVMEGEFLGAGELIKLPEDLHDLTMELKGSEYGISKVKLSVEVEKNGKWEEFREPGLPNWRPSR